MLAQALGINDGNHIWIAAVCAKLKSHNNSLVIMMNTPTESSLKWQRMLAYINQYPELIKPNLIRQLRTQAILRLIAGNALVLLLQYMGLMFSTLGNPLPMWFASGTACAFAFMRGLNVLPGIWLGTFGAYYLAKTGSAMGCATLFTLQVFFIVKLCYRFVSPTLIFHSGWRFVCFVFWAGVVTALVSWLLVWLCNSQLDHLWRVGLYCWLANLNGMLVIGCALIAVDAYFPEFQRVKTLNKIEVGVCYGLLIGCCVALLMTHWGGFGLAILAMTAVSARRFGWCGGVIAVAVVGILLSIGAYFGSEMRLGGLIFLCVNSVVGLYIGSLLHKKTDA